MFTQENDELYNKQSMVYEMYRLKVENYIANYPSFPSNKEQQYDSFKEVVHSFLKSRFVGYRVRMNKENFAIRFDSDERTKAILFEEKFLSNDLYKNAIEKLNVSGLNFLLNNRTFLSTIKECFSWRRETDKEFLYVPFNIGSENLEKEQFLINSSRWSSLRNKFSNFTSEIENYFTIVSNLDSYEQSIIEKKAELDEAERLRIISDRELTISSINRVLENSMKTDLPSFESLNSDEKELLEAVREKGLPYFLPKSGKVSEAFLEAGLKVRILRVKNGSEEAKWFAVPSIWSQGPTPEGIVFPGNCVAEVVPGFGRITSFDYANPRSKNGTAPIVVERQLFVSFDMAHWSEFLPSDVKEVMATHVSLESELAIERERRAVELAESEAVIREEEKKRVLEHAESSLRAQLDDIDESAPYVPSEPVIPNPAPPVRDDSEARKAELTQQLRKQLGLQ